MTLNPTSNLPELTEWSSDPHPLMDCLGAGAELSFPGFAPFAARIVDFESLDSFLHRYGREFLVPVELQRIQRVAGLAARSMYREIISEDAPTTSGVWDPVFLSASRRVGRSQLRRLRPLRDLKGLARYREAVEQGKALGTHTAVYGIMLGIYSIPLRQGLAHYASQTLHALADSGADRLELHGQLRLKLHSGLDGELWTGVQREMDRLLPASLGFV